MRADRTRPRLRLQALRREPLRAVRKRPEPGYGYQPGLLLRQVALPVRYTDDPTMCYDVRHPAASYPKGRLSSKAEDARTGFPEGERRRWDQHRTDGSRKPAVVSAAMEIVGLLLDGESGRTYGYYHDLRMNTVYYRPEKWPAPREPRERLARRESREGAAGAAADGPGAVCARCIVSDIWGASVRRRLETESVDQENHARAYRNHPSGHRAGGQPFGLWDRAQPGRDLLLLG